MRDLNDYTQSASTVRVLAVCLLIPFPCLALMTLIDYVPLARPEEGANANYVHWCRHYVATALISYAILEQFRYVVAGVRLEAHQIAMTMVLASAAGVGSQYIVALVIGFPVPFSLVVGTPAWTLAMTGMFLLYTDNPNHQSADFRTRMKKFFGVFSGQTSLTLIYPAYIFGLVSMRHDQQWAFVLLLPVIKIAAKNWFSRAIGELDDMKPELVVFSIEIFNALYVACSMQSTGSLSTTLMLMTLDLIHSCMSIYDVNELIAEISVLMNRVAERKNHAYNGKTCIEIALLIIDEDAKVRNHTSLRRFWRGSLAGAESASVRSFRVGVHSFTPMLRKSNSARPLNSVMPLAVDEDSGIPSHDAPAAPQSPRLPPPKLSQQGARIFTSTERLRFVQKCTKLLFTTEFVLLIEYTEVIIPIIYGELVRVCGQPPEEPRVLSAIGSHERPRLEAHAGKRVRLRESGIPIAHRDDPHSEEEAADRHDAAARVRAAAPVEDGALEDPALVLLRRADIARPCWCVLFTQDS